VFSSARTVVSKSRGIWSPSRFGMVQLLICYLNSHRVVFKSTSVLFTAPELTAAETDVLGRVEDLRGKLSRATEARVWTGFLRRVMLARAIQGSNSIEGHTVTVDDAVAAVDGENTPLDANEADWAATTGYRDAMTYVLQLAGDPHFEHSTALIRGLHYMILRYDLTKNPGKWRRGPIFVRNNATGERVYEGPEADMVDSLMRDLVSEMNTASGAHALVRAAMSHLNLVMIHPFSDGNGRMGRVVQSLVLAREGVLSPQFCSIEEWLGRNTQAYYDVLAKVGAGSWHPERDALPWIRLSLTAHYQQAMTLLRRTRELSRLWDRLEEITKGLGLFDRAVLALVDAALGFRVRNATYRSQADISNSLASLDLGAMARHGLLISHGENRGRYYVASDVLRKVREEIREPKVPSDDPFALLPDGAKPISVLPRRPISQDAVEPTPSFYAPQQPAFPGFWLEGEGET
jgi:Fic family protein